MATAPQRAPSLRLKVLDSLSRVLALLSIAEVGALAYDIAVHPEAPGILSQGLIPRVVLGLIAGPSIILFGLLLRWRAPRNAVGRYLLLLGMAEVGAQFSFDFGSPLVSGWALDLFILYAGGIGAPSIGYLLLHFPTGKIYPPRWTRWVTAAAVLKFVGVALELMASPSRIGILILPFNPWFMPQLVPYWPVIAVTIGLSGLLLPILSTAGLTSLVLRYRAADTRERQQIKWVVWAPGIGILGAVLALALRFSGVANSLLWVALTFFTLAQLTLLAALTIAILRYHLFDIDQLINRTLVYGALTVVVIALYGLVVGLFSVLFQTSGNYLISLLATGLVAILFQHVRDRIQRSVNRLMYGERDEPYAALARFGRRLEATLTPETVLPTIVETVAQALKLPYAAIELTTNDDGRRTEAVFPPSTVELPSELVRLPLIYQNEPFGHLVLAPRAGDETFSPADSRLLEQFAHQAGVAAYAVRLTRELQRSRERLVLAREEERRRIRRDLHDGLGPALAAQTLKVGSARALFAQDPQAADKLLGELERDIQVALADIRRLVYDLRPPALDELGLVTAIRTTAAQYTMPSRVENGAGAAKQPLSICVESPEQLPPLPAAIEVAAYRIVQEALTNVVRHSQARSCRVHIQFEHNLTLEITDDGRGVSALSPAGVGLHSMRERAAELGGTCVIEPHRGGGTRVYVELPLGAEVSNGHD